VLSAKHTKKVILRTRVLWMRALSISHLEEVQKSSKYCAIRIPPVQESSSTRVVNKGGKQNSNRSSHQNLQQGIIDGAVFQNCHAVRQ
jgi:hypothetical protein